MANNRTLHLILLFALFLRLFGIGWDNGFHLHPDERMLIMVADRIHFFDQLNPNFFNYGTLPIYILKGSLEFIDWMLDSRLATYDGMLWGGRVFSAASDVLTVFFIYQIARILFKKKPVALFSATLYAIAFFPIQNSHFFVVDVFLTTLTTLLIYLIIKYNQIADDRGQFGNYIYISFIALIFAAMLATKFTAIIFLPFISFTILIRQKTRLIQKLRSLLIFYLLSLIFFFLFMPYAIMDIGKYISDISAQMRMNSNPYIFPYTLQYVGTLPYLYYLKNIFLWGLGPFISLTVIVGLVKFIYQSANRRIKIKYLIFDMHVLYFLFYILYFLLIGRSAVKFMRYMLPMYPFFAVLAGYGLSRIGNWKLGIRNYIFYGLLTLQTVWLALFMSIYTQPNTRIMANEWILKNIPYGASIAVEHWDDRLPLEGSENYQMIELPLYELPDNKSKWLLIEERLRQTDYIVIASNRLYVPLQKLSDCLKYKVCYPKTAQYYQKLFGGEYVIDDMRFQKVAEFASYPKLEIGNWKLEIPDDAADESFTVYDHPKILIFKNTAFQL